MNALENGSQLLINNKQRESFFLPMDPSRGKQHIYKSYKSSNCQRGCHIESNNYNTTSSNGYFKTTRIQKSSLKWRKDHHYKGNYRSRHPYRKSDASSRKSNKSTEDMEEEERKKKLNDTAKKLLSKIETWNAEKNISEESNKSKEDSQQSVNINQIITECDSRHNEDKIGGDSKKRIAHSKKPKLVKNRTPKRLRQSAKTTAKYDVNKATVKDFQNRIQHKLIEEIMQMPKENLQNVLNDPKINPVMGLKMSRLVQENRPLITQKLRALAESKMKSLGFTSNQQLLVDIDKLIDPVIETDLSALPYELIKQMENLFQVQFDYSPSNLEACQVGIDSCDSTEGNGDPYNCQEMVPEISSLESNDKLQNNLFKEDLSLYECSTDEDEEISAKSSVPSNQGHDLSPVEGSHNLHCIQETADTEKDPETGYDSKTIIRKLSGGCQPSADGDSELCTSEAPKSKEEIFLPNERRSTSSEVNLTMGIIAGSHNVPEEIIQTAKSSSRVFTPASCQTEGSFHSDASTQTSNPSEEPRVLYGVTLPKESADNNTSSLLEEVHSIQNLTNKLNERRLMIFLELSRMNPNGNFVCDNKTKENFAETLSNGSVYLVEALEDFFKVHSRKNYENHTFRSNNRRWQSSGKWVNKGKSKNREDR